MSNWYIQSGKDSDVVISTRIRLARNLADFKFNINKEEASMIEKIIEEKSNEIGYNLKFLKLKNMDEITKLSLVEKNIISPELAAKEDRGAILVNEEENISIMVNEEEHLRIQVFNSGLELENTLNLAIEVDEKIQELFNIAKSKEYGYLTTCPTNVGTGIRVSVMVHLPGLARTGNIRKILNTITSFGMEIRGTHGENTKSEGDMYQISNKQTLGVTEEDIIKKLRVITEKIIEQERRARKYLSEDEIEIEDKVYRSYGILKNCRRISQSEAIQLLTDVKLGTDMGIITEMTDKKVLELYMYIKPANLQKYFGTKMDVKERDIKRAEMIKKVIG
ncbi:MAG: protein arginine kinase [Clostridia bacterium]|nr:protein arginine kinase [Clostridia bacterium]